MLPKIRHLIEYGVARFVALTLNCLSLPIALKAGEGLGRLCYRLDRRHRRIVDENLTTAFAKEKEVREREKIAMGAFEHLGHMIAECSRLPHISNETLREWVEVCGLEHYHAAKAMGRGVLFVTAHLGNWECMPAVLAATGHPVHLIARPLNNPLLDAWVNAWRARGGGVVISKHAPPAKLVKLLKQGETVGLLLDQNTALREAVFVDYFGRPAATHKGLAVLALRTEAPVLPIFIYRIRGRHRLEIEAPLKITRSDNLHHDIMHLTACVTQIIERYVRRYPGQWLWGHKRWKTRPTSVTPTQAPLSTGE